jgi:glycosyltransferase involved in cell wall biosynthesis
VKVLILHQHYNTPEQGGAIRSYYLAKALADLGLNPIVITAHSKKAYVVERSKGIEVHYLPVPYNNRFNFYQRGVSFLRYVTGAIRLAGKFRDAKMCYAISVPLTVGLAALWIRKRYKIPFIFEVGDLWPDAPIQMGFVKNYFLKRALYALEKLLYNEAQSIVALSPAIKIVVERKVKRKTVHLIPNMADTDFYKPAAKDPALENKFGVTGKFVVSYTGALGVANGLDYYIECARVCQQASLPIHFLLCGDGAMLDHLKKAVERLALQNLSIIPFQNRNGVREILNVTDASFTCYQPFSILETGSPNKYFDGLAAGKLMVINFSGWIQEEIEQQACGVYCDPRDPGDFARKIKPFLADRSTLIRYQQAARSLAETSYSRRKLSEKFVEIIRQGISASTLY